MIANYHTHTVRCNHASGTEEEYVQHALAAGLEILGFSDHTPYPFDNGYRSGIRMCVEELPEYCAEIGRLKNQYKDRIKIHTGLEAEYYPAHFEELRALVRNSDVEYMILGQHWINNEYDGIYNGRPTADEQHLQLYCRQVLQGAETGLFSYVAHPDLICFVGEKGVYERHIRVMCRELAGSGIPLEINMNGLETQRHYPNVLFWQIAAEEGCRGVLGVDAHRPEQMDDLQLWSAARSFAAEFDMKYVEKVELRPVR